MKKRVVGVDVTGKSIRAVQVLHRTGQRSLVEKFIEYPLEQFDATFDQTRPRHLARHIREMWAAAGFNTKLVAMGVGGADVFVKEFTAPDLPKSKLKRELPELAKPELPMSIDEVVLDFYANSRSVAEEGGDPALSGLLVAASRQLIDDYMEATRSLKLKVISIDLIPFALTRTFAKHAPLTGVRAFVRAANSFINIVVTEGRSIVFVRLVPWEHVPAKRTKASQQVETEGISFGDFQDTDTSQITVVETLDQQETALHRQAIRELEDTLRYFQTAHPDKPIEEILVSGYRLDNPAFIQRLGEGKAVAVTGITRSGLGHKRSTSSKVESSDVPDHLAVALALAEGVGQ